MDNEALHGRGGTIRAAGIDAFAADIVGFPLPLASAPVGRIGHDDARLVAAWGTHASWLGDAGVQARRDPVLPDRATATCQHSNEDGSDGEDRQPAVRGDAARRYRPGGRCRHSHARRRCSSAKRLSGACRRHPGMVRVPHLPAEQGTVTSDHLVAAKPAAAPTPRLRDHGIAAALSPVSRRGAVRMPPRGPNRWWRSRYAGPPRTVSSARHRAHISGRR